MAWLKGDLTFAQVAAKKFDGSDTDVAKYTRAANETDLQYVQRLKRVIHSTKTILTEFPVYELKKNNKTTIVAARNDVVAKFLAIRSRVSRVDKTCSEEKFVNRMLSNLEETYDVEIDTEMSLEEATYIAREQYHASHKYSPVVIQNSLWLTASCKRLVNRSHYKEEILVQ
jgi:hypothetical protein